MKAVVFRGAGDVGIEEVPEPGIEQPTDALVRITASAICGTDLHLVRGSMTGMVPGTILGHEGVGEVEEFGEEVRNLDLGDRVVIASTIACGTCAYCRHGFYSQCDRANPNGPLAGTAFFGGPKSTGPFNGLQAERARIPYASVGLVKLPDEVTDEQALMLSDILPTGYFGAQLADVRPGRTVAIFGCGPVGQVAIAACKLLDAGRIFAIDGVESRLEMARAQGAEVINFEEEDPVDALRRLTGGIGPDRVIDAVGVDAVRAHDGGERRREGDEAPGQGWHPGNAPSQAFEWAVEAISKAGTIGIVGVYPNDARTFPIGAAMQKNLSVKMGNCPHRKYIPILLEKVQSGVLDPAKILTQQAPIASAVEAYHRLDVRQPQWGKVELQPAMSASPGM